MKLKYLFFVLLPVIAFAQNQDGKKFQDEYQLKITRTNTPIKIDGELDESIWQTADIAKGFWQKYPNDKVRELRKTEVRAAYDDKFIYFSAICYDSSNYVIQTLKRDTRYFESDGFAISLDPVNRRTNGFFFGVSPLNVQSEDLLSAFTFGELPFSWNNKWISATKNYADHWTVEIAIPFKTLRYEAENTKWGINFIRSDLKNNRFNTWTHVPEQFAGYDFGYTGALIWDKAPTKQNLNASIIPYITGSLSSDSENGVPTTGKFSGGFDAKLSLSSSMNLDLTVNPDFSQVEVDQQQTNLTRFNLFFPEKRTFFLENDDIFSNYGFPGASPFYSRTIGLDKNGNSVPILAGVRMTGNLDKNWRIGLMNIQTGEHGNANDGDHSAAQNYTAFTFNRQIWSRSTIKGYFLNRQGFSTDAELKANPLEAYGRNAGLEFSYLNAEGNINFWGGYHLSFKPNITEKNDYFLAGFFFAGRKIQAFTNFVNFSKNYYADMGFVDRILTNATKDDNYDVGDTTIRAGFKGLDGQFEYIIRPINSVINTHRFGIENHTVYNDDFSFAEQFNRIRYFVNFRNTSSLRLRFDPQIVNLLYYFGLPSNRPLPPGHYAFQQFNVQYFSDSRKRFNFNASFRVGGFYNGTLQQYQVGVNYRVQPWGSFALNFEQNNIQFPEKYGNTTFKLISPKVEISFSNKVFWTTFVQYNTQRNNLNINSRLQWRCSPMSDFYLVYTDNYFVDPTLQNRSRAIVFKLNYWLTV